MSSAVAVVVTGDTVAENAIGSRRGRTLLSKGHGAALCVGAASGDAAATWGLGAVGAAAVVVLAYYGRICQREIVDKETVSRRDISGVFILSFAVLIG